MALRLPRLPSVQPTWSNMQRWWQTVVEAIEGAVQDLAQAIADIIVAQATADGAQVAAEAAQTSADAAQDAADAALAEAQTKQPLDAGLTSLSGLVWTAGRQVPTFTALDTLTLVNVGAASAGDLIDRAAGDARYAASGSGVLSFNSRTGAVTLLSADVTGALTYTPTSVTGLTGVQSVAAFKTGLSLVKADVGLGSVDNTADAAKSVLSAATLTTARNIAMSGDVVWSVSFDGSGNVTAAGAIQANAVTFSKFVAASAASIVGATGAGNFAQLTPASARSVMGLGTAAVENTGASGATLPFLNGTNTWSGVQTITVAGSATIAQLTLNGTGRNWIGWGTAGIAGPATTTRSAGTKLVLYPTVSASTVDYAIGVESGGLWFSVPDASTSIQFYGGTTLAATILAGKFGVKEAAPKSNIESGGSFGAAIATVTATTALTDAHHTVLCDATSGAITINLPAASTATRRIYNVKKIDASANAVTIDGNGAETIDGAATKAIATQWGVLSLQSNGTAWFLL
jgi:hypothetical protein